MAGKRKGKKAASDPYIPIDLCEEILYRLPSNDLLNFKLVCKDWVRLISSKGFIQKHLQRSKADFNNHLRILLKFGSTAQIIGCANNTSKKILSSDQRHILGCCDGLVIYYDSFLSKIAALNPCTGESLPIGGIANQSHLHFKLRCSLKFSWFGHHPFTAQYVLLLVYWESGTGSITFELYSLSPDRSVDSLPLISSSTHLLGTERSYLIKCKKTVTLLHGRLHFPAIVFDSGGYGLELFVILVYDFETEKFMKMARPGIKHAIRMLGVVDGCLCAVQEKIVWMMKEYGVEESWTKYANLDEFPLASFSPNGDVTITSDGLREREAYKISSKFSYIAYDWIACIDSLISPTLLWREEE